MSAQHYMSLLAVGGWLVAGFLIPLVPARQRVVLFWVMVVLGVPALGWLTLLWGPGIGLGAFAIGLWVLLRSPLAETRQRGPGVHRSLP